MQIEENVLLAPFTTFHIGGPARYLVRVQRVEELPQAINVAREKKLTHLILGGGSNLLIRDEGFEGCVVRMENSAIEWRAHNSMHAEVIADAGVAWDTLVRASIARGLHGLENLSGIPGTVGAAPVQNIGAYGQELKDTCAWVEVFDTRTNNIARLSAAECAFAYRDSMFKHEEGSNFIITRVACMLARSAPPNISYKDLNDHFIQTKNPDPTLQEIRNAVLYIRAQKFPNLETYGTAGSFFKNPIISQSHFEELKHTYPALPGFAAAPGYVKISLAWILDNVLAAKGMREGAALAWHAQPLVLATEKGATARNVRALAERITREVYEKTKITLEREVRVI